MILTLRPLTQACTFLLFIHQAGFNAGDGVNFYEIEGAGTDSIINLTLTSNVCIPGRWIFRVDSPEIQGGKYSDRGK